MAKTMYEHICDRCSTKHMISSSTYRKLEDGRQKNCYCSKECHDKAREKRVKVTCDNCGKEYSIIKSRAKLDRNHNYCSPNCQFEFQAKEARETRKCEFCGEEFVAMKKINQRFCSVECHNFWQKDNALTGENSPNWSRISVNCDYCKKELKIHHYKFKTDKYHFCNAQCRKRWHAEVFSQNPEWKEESRNRMLNLISSGFSQKLDSAPQLIVDKLLDDLGINYEREKIFGKYVADNYLIDYNLIIEVQGDYWHCNPNTTEWITEDMLDRIHRDKDKKKFIYEKYDINILYLWESDIKHDPIKCSKLIESYVANKGVLSDYNSFNYGVINGCLELNDKIVKPFYDDSIRNFIDMIVLNFDY